MSDCTQEEAAVLAADAAVLATQAQLIVDYAIYAAAQAALAVCQYNCQSQHRSSGPVNASLAKRAAEDFIRQGKLLIDEVAELRQKPDRERQRELRAEIEGHLHNVQTLCSGHECLPLKSGQS